MAGLWDSIAQMVKEGRGVNIAVPAEAEETQAPRLRGRPKHRDPNNPYSHYATPVQGHGRPSCLSCKKKLKSKDIEVCSESCWLTTQRWLQSKLSRLENCPYKFEDEPCDEHVH